MFDLDFDSVSEPKPLSKGKYLTQITHGEVKETGPNSKNPGRPQLVFSIGFIGPSEEEQMAPAVRHYISLPHPDDEAKTFKFKLLMLKRFLVAYGLPLDRQFDPNEVAVTALGATGTVEVDLTEPDDNGNVYNRIILPKLGD